MIRLSVVAATANAGKLSEMRALTHLLGAEKGFEVLLEPRPAGLGHIEEPGRTLQDNARIKAVTVAQFARRPALADDSGLEVDALGGSPGVDSAIWAGEQASDEANVAKLLKQLEAGAHLDSSQRRARFRTVLCVATPGGECLFAEGVCEGEIALSPRGEGGFGYDPVFVPSDGDGRTFGQMSPEEKDGISHRARAFEAFFDQLAQNPSWVDRLSLG
jgi:XTP/dITP diphosphohydrolase